VAKHLELATEMMLADAGLHSEPTLRQIGEPGDCVCAAIPAASWPTIIRLSEGLVTAERD
jgi:hypothetical protein